MESNIVAFPRRKPEFCMDTVSDASPLEYKSRNFLYMTALAPPPISRNRYQVGEIEHSAACRQAAGDQEASGSVFQESDGFFQSRVKNGKTDKSDNRQKGDQRKEFGLCIAQLEIHRSLNSHDEAEDQQGNADSRNDILHRRRGVAKQGEKRKHQQHEERRQQMDGEHEKISSQNYVPGTDGKGSVQTDQVVFSWIINRVERTRTINHTPVKHSISREVPMAPK